MIFTVICLRNNVEDNPANAIVCIAKHNHQFYLGVSKVAAFLHGETVARKCSSCKKGYNARKYTHKDTVCDGVTLQNRVNNILLCKILIIV